MQRGGVGNLPFGAIRVAAWAAEVSAPRAALAVPKHFPQPNASHDLRGVGEWVEVGWKYRLGRNTVVGTENRSVLCVRTPRVPSHKHKCFDSGRVAAVLRTQVFQTMEEGGGRAKKLCARLDWVEPSGSLLARVLIVSFHKI